MELVSISMEMLIVYVEKVWKLRPTLDKCISDFTVNISSFLIFTGCGILSRIYWLTSYSIFNLELLVLRYTCKSFPLGLLYEKNTVQAIYFYRI